MLSYPWCEEYRKVNSVLRSVEKKNWDEFTGGLFFNKLMDPDVHHNNSNNLEATFMKLSEKIQYFITEFIDVWKEFAESYCFVTVAVKRAKKSFPN